tara:strand:+ start:2925 stop:3854 length:930 start_codon:yes stop_codon:yes gene_type:complete
MHVIITGGLGFIGSNIAKRMLNDGHTVTILDNLETSVAQGIDGANTIHVDITDADAVAALDLPDSDCVIHLAGPSAGMESNASPVQTLSKGYGITLNAIDLATHVKAKRFIIASSMVVYGYTEDNPVPESAPCLPVSHYAIGKFANERLVAHLCHDRGIRYNQLRFFNVYGPGQDLARLGQGLVSIFIALLMRNPRVEMKGSPERFRDVVHINDVVEACVRCAESPNMKDGPLNIGSGEAIVYGELMRIIADEMGIADAFEIIETEGVPGDLFGICADISRLKSELGFVPAYAPEKGVREFTRWVLDNR